MKTKQITKIFCDVLMFITFLLLVLRIGNIAFHELLGVSVAVLYILHIALNLAWIKKIFSNKINTSKDRIYICLDALLLAGIITITVTGIIISQVLFSFDSGNILCSQIHHIASYITLAIMGIHIGAHIEYLYAFIIKTANNLFKKSGLKVMSAAVAIIIVFTIVYSQIYSSYKGNLQNNQSQNTLINDDTSKNTTTVSETTTSLTSTTSSSSTADSTTSKEKKTKSTTVQTTEAVPSLSDYLGNLFCTGCGKHCSLLSPQCGRGMQQAEQAQQEYESQYSN